MCQECTSIRCIRGNKTHTISSSWTMFLQLCTDHVECAFYHRIGLDEPRSRVECGRRVLASASLNQRIHRVSAIFFCFDSCFVLNFDSWLPTNSHIQKLLDCIILTAFQI
ncbi:hypothetical protein M758_9G090800 [Ceratodon purpureus]|uniref:Uncharacterized protein n=1 Tax=Ceratodon purpureus TaxID=3225 RepID=A0A8T0GWA1_CERPU|nr:hypothetical protein KC19_9G165400 [Ceratodon purpureus]KAG0605828.1 hypothetical protein M758_9G090800 [Ceratodon purpureus]